MSGTLYIVATPIGNLEDLTPRARQTLAAVDLIAAEDTRHSGRLLFSIGVKTPLIALHDHNESLAVTGLIEKLLAGKNVALVSDAGTPLISDPGYRLVRSAHENAITVSPLPGPSAVTAALAAAGLPTDRFTFEGFLPAKAAARRRVLETLAHEPRTMVFFESVHRIDASLNDLVDAFGGERPAFVGRELSKLHEQCVHATLGELLEQVADKQIVGKGEFVLVVSGSDEQKPATFDVDKLLVELAAVLPGKQAAAIVAKLSGENRNALYRRMLEMKIE